MQWLVFYAQDSGPTFITAHWAKDYIQWLTEQGEEVEVAGPGFLALTGNRWGRQVKEGSVDPDVILYLGHGLSDRILGQATFQGFISSMLPLLKVNDNPEGKVMFPLACLSGLELLPYLGRREGISSLGFTSYAYVAYAGEQRNYMQDFGNMYFQVVKSIQKQESLRDAKHAFINKLNELVTIYQDLDEADMQRENLIELRNHTKIFGDPEWQP